MGQDLVIKGIGVLEFGSIGCGIAQVAEFNGYQARAECAEKKVVEAAINRLDIVLQNLARKNLVREQEPAAELSGIESGRDHCFLNQCDSIIEAACEDRKAKQGLSVDFAATSSSETVFASNTCGLSNSSLVSNPSRPERLSGLHFFNPAPMMNLVGVVRTNATSQDVVGLPIDSLKSLGKFPSAVRNQAEFLVNCPHTPYGFDSSRSLFASPAEVSGLDHGMRLGCGHTMGPTMNLHN